MSVITTADIESTKFSSDVNMDGTCTNFWMAGNKLHRVEGPAIEYANGGCKWFIHGVQFTESEFNYFTVLNGLK